MKMTEQELKEMFMTAYQVTVENSLLRQDCCDMLYSLWLDEQVKEGEIVLNGEDYHWAADYDHE